jgi:hypothetical protein
MLKNVATAPLIYFDNAPVHGSFGGNIEVELTARYLSPRPDDSVIAEPVCVAHLRCTPQSAATLIDVLQRAIEIGKQQQELMSGEMLAN